MLPVVLTRRWRDPAVPATALPRGLPALAWWAAGLAVALRLARAAVPASPDEAGFLLVGAAVHRGGEFLYGGLWVDRPPLLVGLFALAASAGGLPALRLLGAVAVACTVLALSTAGRTVGGRRGARWAAVLSASLCSLPLLSAPTVTGELLALPFVAGCCALALAVVGAGPGTTRRCWLLVLAGAAGAAAVLVKQNLADGLVLAAVLVLCPRPSAADRSPRERSPERSRERWRDLALLACGAAVPLVAALAWAAWWTGSPVAGVSGLWDAVVGFRARSLGVLGARSSAAQTVRALQLAGVAVVSGIAPLLLMVLLPRGVDAVRGRVVPPVVVATAAAAAWAVPSVGLGGSYWTHYLLELVPVTALAAAQLSGASRGLRRAGAAVVACTAVLSLAATAVVAVSAREPATCGHGLGAQRTRDRLALLAEPGDTAVLVYGGANTLVGVPVTAAYPYLWSLPVRALDPELTALRAAVTGPGRATWVVEGISPGAWGLDADRRLRRALSTSYRPVTEVCGRRLLLRSDVVR